MSDLISRKALIKKLFFSEDGKKYPTRNVDNFQITITMEELRKIISKQPTAYNMDKVIEKLDKASDHYECEEQGREDVYMVDLTDAIEIVKGGGVE